MRREGMEDLGEITGDGTLTGKGGCQLERAGSERGGEDFGCWQRGAGACVGEGVSGVWGS